MERTDAIDDFDRPLEPEQVCALLARSKASIYRHVSRGALLDAMKVGRSSRWRAGEVRAFIAGGKERVA